MAQRLPFDVERRNPSVDLAYVQVLRLALRGCRADDAVVTELGAAFDRKVLSCTLGRLDRLLDDEPTVTIERARSLVAAALATTSVRRSA